MQVEEVAGGLMKKKKKRKTEKCKRKKPKKPYTLFNSFIKLLNASVNRASRKWANFPIWAELLL